MFTYTRRLHVIAFLLVAVAAWAEADWSGNYRGVWEGQQAISSLRQQGNNLEGRLEIAGYPYGVKANIQGNTASGQLLDAATGGAMPLSINLEGGRLSYRIQSQMGSLEIVLQAVEEGANPPPTTTSGQSSVERDPYLVGRWMHTESMSSGSFSGAVQTTMVILANGTYQYGEGQFAGGGAAGSGVSRGDGYSTGEWKTQNSIVYVREQGAPQWQPHARYYVEGGRLMFTFADGSRQIWHRN